MIYPATFEQKIGFDRLREQVAARCTMRAARERLAAEGFSTSAREIERRLALADEMRLLLDMEHDFPGGEYPDVDYIVATYSITDERKKVVSFAGPYFVAGQDLLVRKDETSIKGPEDLNGKRLCSVTGSTSAVTVKEKFANEVQLMEQPGYAECATALFSGIVDAVTTDDIILAGLASASRGRLRVVGKPFTQEYYGVGIKKGDTKLATQINNAIADMIQDGSWQRAISDNTKGTAYTPNAKYNPPEPTEGER